MVTLYIRSTWFQKLSCTYLGSGDCDEDVGCTGDAAVVVVEAVGDCMGGRTVICSSDFAFRVHRIFGTGFRGGLWPERPKCPLPSPKYTLPTRLGRIEIQVRSNLDRGRFLALYLVRRTNFEVSMTEKIPFAYTTYTFCGSLDTEPVSWFWFADPHFVVLS